MITKKRITLSLIAVTLLCTSFLAFANSVPGMASSVQPISAPERADNNDFGSLLPGLPPHPVYKEKSSAGFVEVKNGHFFLNGQPFSHVGVNEPALLYYIGFTNPGTLEAELDALRDLGIKQVRVFLPDSGHDKFQVRDRVEWALDAAGARGIRLTIAFTDMYGDLNKTGNRFRVQGEDGFYTWVCLPNVNCLDTGWFAGNTRYLELMDFIVTEFRNRPEVFAWEIGNEITMRPGEDRNNLVNFYTSTAQRIKQIDPNNHLVTAGIAGTGWALLNQQQVNNLYGNPNINYITIHKYVDDGNPFAWPDLQLASQFNKPIVLEEFGVHKNVVNQKGFQYVRDLYFNAYQQGIDAILQWGVQVAGDYGVGDNNYGPREQGRLEEYKQLWRDMRHDMEESLDCSTWNNNVQGCDEHGLFDPNPGNDTQDCAYYFCSNQCRARGTSNCEAGCNQFCDPNNSETWSCSTWNNNVQGCDEHGLFDPNPGNDTQDCAYYFCSNQCKPRGTSNCQAGCLGNCR